MNLTFAEDFSSSSELDSELMGTPDSGMYWNRGVHPILTIDNLLTFLPNVDFTFTAWSNASTYGVFKTSRKKSDVVSHENKTYLSLIASNADDPKTPGIDTTYWLETNVNSLRVRSFIWSVEDNFISALSLNRKLEENQFIYNVGTEIQTLNNDFSAWAFESKGSDYLKIRINQMSLQANTTDSVSVYVLNQGILQTTLTLNPNNGLLDFEDVGYIISGKGRFIFAFESQEVLSNNAFNDPLKYDSFVCYPLTGTGSTAQTAVYTECSNSNGLNFNVSTYLDSSLYLTNNKIDFSKFMQAQFELDYIRMLSHNSNSRSSTEQKIISGDRAQNLLATESLNLDLNTVARKYMHEKKVATASINKTFDRYLKKPTGIRVKRSVL